MTTDKQVVDSLTTQGKGMPENDVPPQTIIQPELAGTYGKVDVSDGLTDDQLCRHIDEIVS